MRSYYRAVPGVTALVTSFLAGYSWTASGDPSLFTIAHVVSVLLCLSVPVLFILVGRALKCRPRILKVGAVLLFVSSIPLLIGNGIYLIDIRTPENALGDIGGFGLALLGWVALLITSFACTVGPPLAGYSDTKQHGVGTSSRT